MLCENSTWIVFPPPYLALERKPIHMLCETFFPLALVKRRPSTCFVIFFPPLALVRGSPSSGFVKFFSPLLPFYLVKGSPSSSCFVKYFFPPQSLPPSMAMWKLSLNCLSLPLNLPYLILEGTHDPTCFVESQVWEMGKERTYMQRTIAPPPTP